MKAVAKKSYSLTISVIIYMVINWENFHPCNSLPFPLRFSCPVLILLSCFQHQCECIENNCQDWHGSYWTYCILTAFLRYNLHTIECTHLKYTFPWFLISQSFAINTLNFRVFSLSPKEAHTQQSFSTTTTLHALIFVENDYHSFNV